MLRNPPPTRPGQYWDTEYDGVNVRVTYTFKRVVAAHHTPHEKRSPKLRDIDATAVLILECGKDGYSFALDFPRNFPSLSSPKWARWIKNGEESGIAIPLSTRNSVAWPSATILGFDKPAFPKEKFNQIVRSLYDEGFAAFDMRDKFGVYISMVFDGSYVSDDTARRQALGLIRTACE